MIQVSMGLNSYVAYVRLGDSFLGGASIIAGTVSQPAPLAAAKARTWDPLQTLTASDAVDRYAAAKAIPHRDLGVRKATVALLAGMEKEEDERVTLEMAASVARLGSDTGLEHIVATVWNRDRGDLRMEAVLILTELADTQATHELKRIATAEEFEGDELRQAATWGLGKVGCKAYAELVDLLDDEDDAVALHAIAGFGSDVSDDDVCSLVSVLQHGEARGRAAASEALRLIGSDAVLRTLIEAARGGEAARSWVLATLGRLEHSAVTTALVGDPLLAEVEPLLALGPKENWLASVEAAEDLRFLLQQDIA